MILVDTNILSTFAKIDRLDLLEKVLGEMHISPNVLDEVKRAEELGYSHAEKILKGIKEGKILISCIREDEVEFLEKVPSSFGRGERDCVAIALNRDALIVTNERRVLNYCKRNGIAHVRLNTILRKLWKDEIIEEKEVRDLIHKIEENDSLIIVDKESIFS
ncbi:MAG: hypothetical protein R6U61_08745 [Thermoplasmata archaeon]